MQNPATSSLRIRHILAAVDRTSPESLCAAHKAIWHAEIDMISNDDNRLLQDEYDYRSRDFDNYDINDVQLAERFDEKVELLLRICSDEGVEVV